jgi:formamidopyrimidine-DNA glycosylase
MPELPEVETIARGLARRITGLRVASTQLYRGDIIHGVPVPLCAVLHNRVFRRIARRGKQLHIDLSEPPCPESEFSLVIHLGMTGRLTAQDTHAPLEPHTHLRVRFCDSPVELRFNDPRRFGGIWICSSPSDTPATPRRTKQPETPAHLVGGHWVGRPLPRAGPEPMDLSLADLARILVRRRQIKALLLDQGPIGGIGNIYCDEILHRAGIHPLTIAATLTALRIRRLHRAMRQVLTAAIKAGGSSISDYRTAENTLGYFQQRHRVYDRQGMPCRTCRTAIQRIVVAGRGTFFCRKCQTRKRPRSIGNG